MPKNITDDNRPTVFMDIDGTIVNHNYDPERYEDTFLPGAEETLRELQEKNFLIVLVTSRIQKHCERLIQVLSRKRIFPRLITDLPTGKRIVVNDRKFAGQDKAVAINVERDGGFDDRTIREIFTE
jgi:vacuolar-type H+-ATPase subunit F/Vma7